mmetsp:Transcript_87229/g.167757  ORF Transcript_87229/g.167757 Transcript_87229/m.167757 type:complete len:160 (+) Transcript_87229:363-842(+)
MLRGAAQALEWAVGQSLEQAVEQLVEPVFEQSAGQAVEQFAEQAVEEAVGPSLEQAAEQLVEQAFEQSVEQAVEESLEQAFEESVERAFGNCCLRPIPQWQPHAQLQLPHGEASTSPLVQAPQQTQQRAMRLLLARQQSIVLLLPRSVRMRPTSAASRL